MINQNQRSFNAEIFRTVLRSRHMLQQFMVEQLLGKGFVFLKNSLFNSGVKT